MPFYNHGVLAHSMIAVQLVSWTGIDTQPLFCFSQPHWLGLGNNGCLTCDWLHINRAWNLALITWFINAALVGGMFSNVRERFVKSCCLALFTLLNTCVRS